MRVSKEFRSIQAGLGLVFGCLDQGAGQDGLTGIHEHLSAHSPS